MPEKPRSRITGQTKNQNVAGRSLQKRCVMHPSMRKPLHRGGVFWCYLRSGNFICVRGPVICVQQNSTPKSEPQTFWFHAFRAAESALSFGIFVLRSLGEIYARSRTGYARLKIFTLVREGVTLVQKNSPVHYRADSTSSSGFSSSSLTPPMNRPTGSPSMMR